MLLTLLCMALFLPGIVSVPIMDRDSAHFAQASRQMVQTDNYFQIRYQQKTRFQKPPGINWLQAFFVKVFSDADASKVWPYRIPSLLGGLFSVLFLFGFARRVIGEKTALIAASLLAISLLLVVESHLAVIDAQLLLACVLMQGALWGIYEAAKKNECAPPLIAMCFWLAMGYGFLLKGVTPLVGFLTLISLSIIDKDIRWLKGLRFQWGIPLLLLTMVWVFFVNQAEGANYLFKMVQKDLLPKLKGGHESHGKPPLFHLAILPVTFWPASLFLWQTCTHAFKYRHRVTEKFLLAWILPTWIFFELMPTKLPQYVLPTFPAIAILAACAIAHFKATTFTGKNLVFFRVLLVLWAMLSITLGLLVALLPVFVGMQLPLVSYILIVFSIVFAMLTTFLVFKNKFKQCVVVVTLGSILFYGLFYQILLPGLKPLWLSKTIVAKLKPYRFNITTTTPLLAIGFSEPSLVFNLNTNEVKFTSINDAIDLIMLKKHMLVIEKSTYLQFLKNAKKNAIDLKQREVIKGINYSKGRFLELIILEAKKQ
jgi:4-amino-4-deoxy-L-arabinose transferase-like glycosyltransferase